LTLLCLIILCADLLCADLATARGSFLLDGWRVWTNATVSPDAKIETGMVPVRIKLASHQTLWIGSDSFVRFDGNRILLERGCAQLDVAGAYSLGGKETSGLLAGSDAKELLRAARIPRFYESAQELRPMSQRP
jgi:hypothetical protein